MPKVTHPDKNTYVYNCTCGAEITLITDTTPKRLIKCFKCGKKESVEWEQKNKTKGSDNGTIEL